MSEILALVGLAILGLAGGRVAYELAERELMSRDDAPGPPPQWARPASVLAGAVAFAVLGAVVGASWVLFAYLAFGVLSLTLSITDLRNQLIPDRLNFNGTAIAAGLLLVGAVADLQSESLSRGFAGAMIYFAILLLIYLPGRGRAFGGGDVKLGPLLGLFTAFRGWDVFGAAIVLGILIGAVGGTILVIFKLRGLRDHFAFGPPLVLGAYVSLLIGAELVAWYTG